MAFGFAETYVLQVPLHSLKSATVNLPEGKLPVILLLCVVKSAGV